MSSLVFHTPPSGSADAASAANEASAPTSPSLGLMRAFAAVASDLPMAQWPTRFWTLLGQRQALREPVGGQWLPPLAALGEMGPLPRLAFLLRVGGSLDEGIAMRVLDQDEAGYQHLLADACPRDAHGQPEKFLKVALNGSNVG